MESYERALATTARGQLGLLHRTEVLRQGLTPRMVDVRLANGRLELVHPSVMRVSGAPTSWEQLALAACLGGGAETLVSHRAAALLHHLDGFGSAPVEVTTRRSRRFFPDSVVVHRPVLFHHVDRATSGLIPVTSIARTLIDLGAVCRPHKVEEALDGALRDGLTSVPFIERRLDALAARGRPGIGVMRALLATRLAGPPPQSVLERRFLRALRKAELPAPEHQYRLHLDGRVIARLDFAWPDPLVAVEVDGHGSHATRRSEPGTTSAPHR